MESSPREIAARFSVSERTLEYAVALFFFLLPFQWALQPTAGVDLPVGRALAPVVALGWLFVRLAQRRLWVPWSAASVALLSFLLISVLSVGWAEERGWAFRKSLFLLTYAPLFFVVADLAREHGARRRLLRALVGGAGIVATVGIFQFFSQFVFGVGTVFHFWLEAVSPFFLGTDFGSAVATYPSLLVNIGGETVLRASAFFPDPHMMAYGMGLSLPLGLYLAVSESSPVWRKLFFGLSGLIVCTEMLTFSRGGYVALGLAGLFVAGLWLGTTHRRGRVWGGVLAILIGVALFSFSPIGERFGSVFSVAEGSNRERLRLWSEAVEYIARRPLTGYGLGNYPLAVKPSAEYREPIYAHNLYLDIATETGVPGLFFFLLFLFGTLFASGTRWVREKDRLALALSGAAMVYATHSLFETPLFSVHIFPLLLVVAALSVGRQSHPYIYEKPVV